MAHLVSSPLTNGRSGGTSFLVGWPQCLNGQPSRIAAPVGRNEAGETVHMLSATVDMGRQSDGGIFEVRDEAGRLVFSGQLPSGSGQVPVVADGTAEDGNQYPRRIQHFRTYRAWWRSSPCARVQARHSNFGRYWRRQSSDFELSKWTLGRCERRQRIFLIFTNEGTHHGI